MGTWEKEKLLWWIHQSDPNILEGKILENFEEILSEGKEGDKPKLLMVPIQITVNPPDHADSHATFVKDYIKWTKSLSEFDVELEFVWITQKRIALESMRPNRNQNASNIKCVMFLSRASARGSGGSTKTR